MKNSSLQIVLHPIAILNISEFYNRMKVNFNTNRVFGGLIGEQHGDKIEIFSIFEFLETETSTPDKFSLDLDFLEQRRKIAEQLYPNYEFIGFFSTNNESDQPNKLDLEVYNSLTKIGVVSPINIVLCSELSDKQTLPIKAYNLNKSTQEFDQIKMEISGYESERICLDTVVKSEGDQFKYSQLVQNENTIKSALTMLKMNLKGVLEMVKDKKNHSNPKFIELIDDLMKNYPKSSSNRDNIDFIQSSLREILILSNVTSTSIGTNYSKNSQHHHN